MLPRRFTRSVDQVVLEPLDRFVPIWVFGESIENFIQRLRGSSCAWILRDGLVFVRERHQ